MLQAQVQLEILLLEVRRLMSGQVMPECVTFLRGFSVVSQVKSWIAHTTPYPAVKSDELG
jgi:hypothetical protein